jgi:hypothetical protein
MSDADPVNTLPLGKLIDYVKTRDKMSFNKLLKRAWERGLEDLSQAQLSAFVIRGIKEYPKPKTIETMAAALDVSYEQVLNACSRELGFPQLWRPGATVIVDEHISHDTAEEYGRRVRRAARNKDHQE